MNETKTHLSKIRGSLIILAIAVLDQLSKLIIATTLTTGQSVAFLPSIGVYITHTTNQGIAFGFFPQFAFVYTLIAIAFIAAVYYFWHTWSKPTQIAMVIIAGGAAGNLIDRLVRGAVIDWFGVSWFSIFNLADAAITIGAILVIISEYVLNKKK